MNFLSSVVGHFLSIGATESPNVIAHRQRRKKASSADTQASYERNKFEPCTVFSCTEPRHIGKSGKCGGAQCTNHKRVKQAKHRGAPHLAGRG